MSEVVLDASALLAVLRREPGWELVEPLLVGAIVSAVNYSEVIKRSVEAGAKAGDARAVIRLMELLIVPFDEPQAAEAGAIYGKTRLKRLSFADRACLALGLLRRCPILTAERKFAEFDLPVEVRVIRAPANRQ